ncbi:MAG: ferredoxin [Proteobacteria bacterium]|nr:ferredoxin [Pseudomonadota bacterium]
MSYKIEAIEGIGQQYAAKLQTIGITTVEGLLEQGATAAGRTRIVEQTDIDAARVLKWVNHADLFRIKGVAGQFAELLEAAGVDTVKEFRNRVAENLHPKLAELNTAKKLVGRVPSVAELADMIAIAKTLEPKVSY